MHCTCPHKWNWYEGHIIWLSVYWLFHTYAAIMSGTPCQRYSDLVLYWINTPNQEDPRIGLELARIQKNPQQAAKDMVDLKSRLTKAESKLKSTTDLADHNLNAEKKSHGVSIAWPNPSIPCPAEPEHTMSCWTRAYHVLPDPKSFWFVKVMRDQAPCLEVHQGHTQHRKLTPTV